MLSLAIGVDTPSRYPHQRTSPARSVDTGKQTSRELVMRWFQTDHLTVDPTGQEETESASASATCSSR